MPALSSYLQDRAVLARVAKRAGVPESQVSARVAGLIEDFGPGVFISCDDLAGLLPVV